ncbi:MAG: hypoxanthine phosphoribosyltransferase [Erysipelothrix sp.]|nr:hypoxanthine phosphoribosyltransferase [Erysipelothrix sp.]
MHKDLKKILIDEKSIINRCLELGQQITDDYKHDVEPPIFIALLKGSVPFLAELVKYVNLDIELDFMDVSSYAGGTESTRDIRILKDLDRSIKGKNIIIVEDIVDTGRTLLAVTKILENKGASGIKVVSLLDKPVRREVTVEVDYVGFEIPNEFVVGFGLDYAEKYRNLPYVGVLKDELY